MEEKVPITFDYKGKSYFGHFVKVPGAANTGYFHLYIDGFYRGQLFYTTKWEFHSNSHEFEDLSDFFGDFVTAWYE